MDLFGSEDAHDVIVFSLAHLYLARRDHLHRHVCAMAQQLNLRVVILITLSPWTVVLTHVEDDVVDCNRGLICLMANCLDNFDSLLVLGDIL